MKKLMIAAAIVCAAAMSQAATCNWDYTAGSVFDGTGGSGKVPEGANVYLIQNSAHDTTAFLQAFVAAGSVEDFASTLASWKADKIAIDEDHQINAMNRTVTAFTAGDAEKAYFAVVNGDNIYLSTVLDAVYSSVGGNDMYNFSWEDSQSAKMKALPKAAGEGYVGAGWYNVPEPTSGLLLLLGVAGLALRRRRA